MSIENWKTDLAPLLHGFQAEPRRSKRVPDEKTTFTDQFGNHLELDNGRFVLKKLLADPSLGTLECKDVDKGHQSFTLYQHAESYYILYETRVDLYGWCGHFKSFVIIPDLVGITEFIENLGDRWW